MKSFSFGTFVCAAVFALALMIPTGTASAEEAVPTLTVNGVGSAQIAPDMAEVTLGVVTEARDAAKAHADNAYAERTRYGICLAACVTRGIGKRGVLCGTRITRREFEGVYAIRTVCERRVDHLAHIREITHLDDDRVRHRVAGNNAAPVVLHIVDRRKIIARRLNITLCDAECL